MIFRKQHFFGWSFWILLILSVFSITLDQKKIVVPRLKVAIQVALTPIEYAATFPTRSFHFIHDYVVAQHTLIHNQKNWQAEQLLLQAKLQEMNTLKQQNQELHALLNTNAVQQKQKYLLAQVISINTEAPIREILINRGSHAGMKIGQGIMSADGIIGQVIAVSPLNSRVILLSDTRSAIPVINQRTQENFIVIGTGNNQDMALLDSTNNSDLKMGDILLSSGIGGHYPTHYPVGIITATIDHTKNIDRTHVKPTANLNRLNLVLAVFVENEDNL